VARPRKFDESDVIAVARDEFWTRGYGATSVDDLTAATGLGKGSLYGAFGDKHGLFMHSFAQYCEEDSRLIEEELSGDDAGALNRVRRHFHLKTGDPTASRRGCLLAKSTAELASADPEVAGMAKAFYANYERALAHCVGQAQAVGDVRADIAAADAGAMLLAALRGIEALGRAGRSRRALRRVADTTLNSLAAAPRPGAVP